MAIARRCEAVTVEAADVRDAVRAVRRGDRDAFGRLVERYERPLFGLALMMVRRPDGAEEVAQDAFIRAYLKLDHYDDSRPFYPWLATIAVRLAQNWLRRHTRIDRREGAELGCRCATSRSRYPSGQ